jgi:Family of unknown function (DUF6282)
MLTEEIGTSFTAGAVDLYVHGSPDLVPRTMDDIALARQLQAARYSAAVHRHQFTPTADRTRIVSDLTGFQLFGAIVLNDTAGGLNPRAVEYALRMGAVWVGLPTVDARHARSLLPAVNPDIRSVLTFGHVIDVVDESGRVLSVLREVLELVRDYNSVLALGYLSTPETLAVARAACEQHVPKIVLSNPLMRAQEMALEDVETVMGLDHRIWLEVSAFQFHHDSNPRVSSADIAGLVRAVGPNRTVLSSDGGIAGTLNPPQLLAWGCSQLLSEGIDEKEIDVIVRKNPRALIDVGI